MLGVLGDKTATDFQFYYNEIISLALSKNDCFNAIFLFGGICFDMLNNCDNIVLNATFEIYFSKHANMINKM